MIAIILNFIMTNQISDTQYHIPTLYSQYHFFGYLHSKNLYIK